MCRRLDRRRDRAGVGHDVDPQRPAPAAPPETNLDVATAEVVEIYQGDLLAHLVIGGRQADGPPVAMPVVAPRRSDRAGAMPDAETGGTTRRQSEPQHDQDGDDGGKQRVAV